MLLNYSRTSHNKVIPICIRFVDENKNIREFLQFTQLTRVTGEAIAKQLFSEGPQHCY